MTETVRTITIEGKTHVLSEGVEVQVKFSDGHGGLFNSAEEAARNKAINDAQNLITGAVDWHGEEFDMQHIMDHRAEIIDALQRIGTDA